MDKACLIVNPVAGSGEAKQLKDDVEAFLQTFAATVDVVESTPEKTIESLTKEAGDAGAEFVFVLGGDGSVSEAVNGIMKSEQSPKFGFLPLGTANDLARNIGLNPDPKRALEELKQQNDLHAIDVGEVNDRYFIDVIALGSLAEAVMETDDQSKNLLGYFAYIKDGAKALITKSPKQYHIQSDEFDETVKTHLMMISIGHTVGRIENLVNGAKNDDGYLYFLAAKDNLKISNWNHLLKAFVTREVLSADEVTAFKTKAVKIEDQSDENASQMNVDGDEGPMLPADISVHQQALTVMIPVKA